MKDFKRENAHKRDCWYRDDESRAWWLDTYSGVKHVTIRSKPFIFFECNCPGCPARLRVALHLAEELILAGQPNSL